MNLISPKQLKERFPAPENITILRQTAIDVLHGKDSRLAAIVGPCSIHDPASALEYAYKLKTLQSDFFIIMRLFFEKPRTRFGWKGMLYDPHLNGTDDIAEGLFRARSLACQITHLGIPCAAEFLEPIAACYFDDLFVWGVIGARTAASPIHRQLASGLAFPVGFKNDCAGRLDTAMHGIASSRSPHSYLGIDQDGKAAACKTSGNPYTHLILRGSDTSPNFDAASIAQATAMLQKEEIPPHLVIDCSHGNSGKDPLRQQEVFDAVLSQAAYTPAIRGLMLESHLFFGKQLLAQQPLHYGISITDACLGWEETEHLFRSRSALSKMDAPNNQ